MPHTPVPVTALISFRVYTVPVSWKVGIDTDPQITNKKPQPIGRSFLLAELFSSNNLAAFVDIDAFALGTAVRNDAVQADIGAVVVILAGYADNACFQVEVEPFGLGDAVDSIIIRSFLFQRVYEIRCHCVIAAFGDVERQLRRQLIIAVASLLGQGFQIVDSFLP